MSRSLTGGEEQTPNTFARFAIETGEIGCAQVPIAQELEQFVAIDPQVHAIRSASCGNVGLYGCGAKRGTAFHL